MTLPVEGLPLHTRSLTVTASRAEAGRWRVLGVVIDLRKSGFVPMVGEAQIAGIIHHMVLDARVDPGTRVLESLETHQHAVAIEPGEGTGGESCRDPAGRLQALVGRRCDAGFAAELGRVFGGPRGCSHLLTLFHLIASSLPDALDFETEQLRALGVQRRYGEKIFRRSVFVDGTEPEEGTLQLAVQLTDWNDRPLAAVGEALDLMGRQREVRAVATVRLADVRILEAVARERARSRETLGAAEWVERSDAVGFLVGRPIMPGLGRAVREELADVPESARLRDALLQLAPGFVQCTPVLGDRLIGRMPGPGAGAAKRGERGRLPGFLALGGAADSCYMWRREGPLVQIRGGPAGAASAPASEETSSGSG